MNIRNILPSPKRLSLLSLLLGLPLPAMAAIHMVTVGDNFFSPSELTIQVGDTVRWTNAAGGNPHDVTSDTGAWTASETSSSFTFDVVFNDPGDFAYRCSVHPSTMRGTITVEGAQAQPELALLSVDAANGEYAPGEMMAIDASINNSGDAGSGAFTITYYASTDSTITAGDHVLGSANVGDVAAGTTANRQDMVTVPESVPAGLYFVGAILTFSDSNAADNVNFDATQVTFLGLFFINAGLNDAWFNAATAGQGFFFTVFPDLSLFFLSWFTYDTVRPDDTVVAILGEAGHRWVTAIGAYLPGDTVTLDVELTEGGVFDSVLPEPVQTAGYGTITITFINCNAAVLMYEFPSLGLSGTIELTRVVGDNVPLCELLNEELQNTP